MLKTRKYIYNEDSLLYEEKVESGWFVTGRATLFVCTVAGFVALYVWLFLSVFRLDPPKTAHLKKELARWQTRIEVLDSEIDRCEKRLGGIEERDDNVYRSIFGLECIADDVKKAGFGGANRYAYLDEFGASEALKSTVHRLDVLTKRAYLQTNALDEVALVARQADEIKSCIPAVSPIIPRAGTYRVSSPFGRRVDPVYRRTAFHEGVDFATKIGSPVYVTGDGVVERVRYQFFGYGNEIVINHGFGYKTRYAHLNSICVSAGQKLVRGQKIGEVGNTGKSTGPHLHYEVIYKNKQVNPLSFMDLSLGVDEYVSMTRERNQARN